MHGYVVPSRIGTFACTTLQLEFSVYSGKKSCKKKYVKNQELINKDLKKKRVDLALSIKQQDQIIAELHNYTNYCTENDEFIVQLYGYCKLTKHLIV